MASAKVSTGILGTSDADGKPMLPQLRRGAFSRLPRLAGPLQLRAAQSYNPIPAGQVQLMVALPQACKPLACSRSEGRMWESWCWQRILATAVGLAGKSLSSKATVQSELGKVWHLQLIL